MKSPFTFSLPFIYKLRYLILIFFITILFSLLACDIVKPKIDQVATPEFDPPGGCYNHLWDRIITIKCNTDGAKIHYTLDGSIPTESSPLYNEPIFLPSIFITVKAIAFKDYMKPSKIAEACYSSLSINPSISLPSGTYYWGQETTISISSAYESYDPQIFYTMDGSEPTQNSTLYTKPIILTQSCVLKAKTFLNNGISSKTSIATYTIIDFLNELIPVQGGIFHPTDSLNVQLSSYKISKYEITQIEYIKTMGYNPSYFKNDLTLPVENVSRLDAIEYCNRRSIREGLEPCYTLNGYGNNPDNWFEGWNQYFENHDLISCNWQANGYRLPTEMEWMYAALGGALSHNYIYSGSNDINSVAWYSGNSGGRTHSVGEKNANELGLYDMSGNVAEWCWDVLSDYPLGDVINPIGPENGSWHSVRGGCYSDNSDLCTVFRRYFYSQIIRNKKYGFRVVQKSI